MTNCTTTSSLLEYDRQVRATFQCTFAGIDEAGRGPLAGPVVAAACILPPEYPVSGINDSKKLSARARASLFEELTGDPWVCYGVGIIDIQVIDAINVLEATKRAMFEAVDALDSIPKLLLVDGVDLAHSLIPSRKIIKGDALSLAIAAASIIAKETRDRVMVALDEQYPQYGFARHKGYGTQAHRDAIKEYGPCPAHRKSFEPVRSMLEATLL
ncbi:Ribonuclease HII [Chlamydiales bacterium SCGC AG-110-P3]|nr:Ribonuclease HII [Chlamydiales bacterium SCGC AG-110-P3]